MVEETSFHERKIDRTAYSSLWGVVGVTLLTYILGVYLLFQVGTLVRHLQILQPHLSLPQLSLPHPVSAVQSVKEQAAESAKHATESAADAAANQAKQAATQKLNQFLSQ